jgi:hypothetical protein
MFEFKYHDLTAVVRTATLNMKLLFYIRFATYKCVKRSIYKGKRFFASTEIAVGLWSPPGLLYYKYRLTLSGEKRPGLDFVFSPPSSAEIKNE